MNLDREFPLKFYINLGPAEDRRRRMLNLFLDHGLSVERLPAVSKRHVQSARGHWDKGRYALALTQKLALREGRRRGATAVLVFEDDVVLHPQWKKRVAALELPEDWGIFYFGCQHLERPVAVSPGIVKVENVWDLHAFAVKAEYYRRVMSVLSPMGRGTKEVWLDPSDRAIATLLKEIPAYAAWPNLAWQGREDSSLAQGWVNDNYTGDGLQRRWLDAVDAVAGVDGVMREEGARCPVNASPCGEAGGLEGHRGRQDARPTRGRGVTFSRFRPLHWQPSGMDVGLGDRIRGLAGMLVFADLAGRTLRVPWVKTEACPGNFNEVLSVSGVEVAANDTDWHRMSSGQIDHQFWYNVVPEDLWKQLHKGWFLTGQVTQEAFMERWRKRLEGFRPAGETRRNVTKLLRREKREGLLGLHIRRTDALSDGWRGLGRGAAARLDRELLAALRERWREGCWSKIVLACDDEPTAERWLALLAKEGMPVIFHRKNWNRKALRQTTLVDAGTDLFLLSRCGAIVASIMGSFCWMASMMGGIPLQVVSGAEAKVGTTPEEGRP